MSMSEEMSEETAPGDSELWQYGNLFWGVSLVTRDLDNVLYLEADSVEVTANGDLVFVGEKGPLLVVAAGRWYTAWAASTSDGKAVAIHETEEMSL